MRRSSSTRSSRRDHIPAQVPYQRRRVGRSRVPLHRRLLTARSALGYWFAVLVLALATATVVSRLASRAAAAERRLGATRPALVTVRPLRAGQRLTSAVARVERRPVAQLPEDSLTHIPRGASVAGPVATGEVLTDARLDMRSRGAATEGTLAMAVPSGDAPLAVRTGDRVDVFATYDPSLAPTGTSPTSRVVERAEVVRTGRQSVTVAVHPAEASALATAVARATITLALVR